MKNFLPIALFLLVTLSCSKKADVAPKPIADFTFSESSDGYVQFVSKSQNATTYLWDFGDGGAGSSSTELLRRYSNNGQYKVSLTAQDASGSADVITKTVIVTKAPTTGNVVIWTSKSNEGKISVWVDDRPLSTFITKYQTTNTAPACNTNGFVTVTAAQGSYPIRAQSENGSKWTGTIIVVNGDCRDLQLK